jgi:long-chain acyl-CoA synthetase
MTYRELDERSNQLAHLFRKRGIKAGSNLALIMDNRLEFIVICVAAHRAGLHYAPISTHLAPAEIASILLDCAPSVLVGTSSALSRAQIAPDSGVELVLSVGDHIDGYEDLATATEPLSTAPIGDEEAGALMLYSSGTTGAPKGVLLPRHRGGPEATDPSTSQVTDRFAIDSSTVFLITAPLYHRSPLFYVEMVLPKGGTLVIMPRFDAESVLQVVEQYGVTHSFFVPTMLTRLLRLPPEVRSKYDLSSHRWTLHGAAPCPPSVKEEIIEWWGPIVNEGYGGSESNGLTFITSEEWLDHRSSVGRPVACEVRVVDKAGSDVPVGQVGLVYFRGRPAFEYHGNEDQTRAAFLSDGSSTLGDLGYLDKDGYLYLTGRREFVIISGGVNIYPQEVENVLSAHMEVLDCAVFGVPNEEFGEEVRAVVQLSDGVDPTPEKAEELRLFCRSNLSSIKCPKVIEFREHLPRTPTGKMQKRQLVAEYSQEKVS